MWEPAEMLDDPTLLQPTLLSFDGNPLTLVLTMSNEASDVCTATDTVMVTSRSSCFVGKWTSVLCWKTTVKQS